MTLSRLAAVVLLAVFLAACGPDAPELRLAAGGPEVLAALAVEGTPPADSLAETRTAFQTDGAGSAWFGALAGPSDNAATGFAVGGERVLSGWRWWLDTDSVGLGPADRVRGVARPDLAARAYEQQDTSGFVTSLFNRVRGETPARLSERITLLDGAPGQPGALLVEIEDEIGTVGFRPVASDRRLAADYRVQREGGTLVFARADRVPTDSTVVPEGPVWTAVATSGGEVRSTGVVDAVPEAGRDASYSLGEVAVETPARIAVATGPTPAAAAAAARAAVEGAAAARERRSARMAALIDDLGFSTRDATTTAAVRWAALTLEALTVRDSSRVYVQAGLPGQEAASYPSAITTMGALVMTGRWADARNLLTTFGAAQRFDRRMDLLGRAPDLVPYGGDPTFATADGTPLFLTAAGDYVRATGDRSLVAGSANFWFKTVFALRGIYESDRRNGNATDTLGFLATREPRGTWLDTDPDAGGLRRVGAPAEAQGALVGALATATQFARIMGVSGRSSAVWYADTSRVLVRQTAARFGASNGLLADRIDVGLQRSPDIRPGGLLLLARTPGFPDRAQHARALSERLVFPYGVASLDQADSLFHPYLTAAGLYSPESARSNGAVWTWIAGPVATLMAETGGAGPAADLLAAQARLLLDRGTVGAIPELVSGHPRAEETPPAVGGAPVQPWSVAGYLEAVYRGLLGVSYPSADTLALAPRLPEAWGETTVRLRLGEGHVRLTLDGGADALRARVEPEGDLPAGATLRLTGGDAVVTVALGEVQGDTLTVPRDAFEVELSGGRAEVDGDDVAASSAPPQGVAWDGFVFAEPQVREEYPVMRAVADQRALGPAQILRDDLTASVALTQTDPDGDDWGSTSTFTYPEGYPEGVLDATYLEVARDDSTTYFRAEFTALAERSVLGFPPTFVALVIDTEDGGERTVGRNARYGFAPDEGFEYVVFAGDGLVVEDGQGRELGRLAPGDGSVFDPANGSLAFSVPTFILPRLQRGARVTLLVGALEPGGVGSFRDVERDASDTVGGGRVDNRAPNVYDVIVGRIR